MIIPFFLFRGNTLDSVNDTPWNDEDESKMFKRSPWLVRRRGRRRIGKLIDRVCKYGRFVPGVGKFIRCLTSFKEN